MPQINISEIDSTSPGSSTTSTYVTLIPGKCAKATGAPAAAVKVGDEFDFTSVEGKFEEIFDSSAESNNLSYKIAYHLLKLGLPIHYVVIADQNELYDAPGTLESGEESAYDKFWKKFTDKSLYDLRFITAGEYANEYIAENILRCAAERGDAVGVVDVDKTANFNSVEVESYAQLITEHTIIRKDNVKESSLGYGAMFTPRITFNSPYFKNDTTKYPASFGYLAAFAAHNLNEFPEWFATAGSIRGVLPYNNVEVDYKYGDADNAVLQDRTTEGNRGVNPIQLVRPYGNIIYGARTLFPNKKSEDGTTVGLKASSFLNIRQLCCSIKKRLYAASRKYTYDPNSDTLWINFKSLVKPVVEEMKTNQGIKGYKFIKQTSTEKATLTARIKIIPIEPVEDFYLTVHMVDSIVDVSE